MWFGFFHKKSVSTNNVLLTNFYSIPVKVTHVLFLKYAIQLYLLYNQTGMKLFFVLNILKLEKFAEVIILFLPNI